MEIAAWWPWATAQMMFSGPQAASPPKNTPGLRRHHGRLVDLRHAPLVELEADVALDPGEAVLLADRHQHVVALEHDLLARGLELRPAALVDADLLHLLEADAGQPALVEQELLGRVVVEDRDALVLGVLDLPGRRLHHAPRRAHGDLHVHAAEAQRRCGSSPWPCCRRRSRPRACRPCARARRRRRSASRCRCGCWPRLPCGRGCRGPCPWARRCR